MNETTRTVLTRIRKEKVAFLTLQFADILGTVRSRLFPAEDAKSLLEEGFGFDGSSITGFVGIDQSDLVAKPDPRTYRVLPWTSGAKKSGRMICDVYWPDDRPFEGDPRFILKRVHRECEEMGYTAIIGPEVEFSLLRESDRKPIDVARYMDYLPYDLAENLKMELFYALRQLGLHPSVAHHEIGPGQNEINIECCEPLDCADNVVAFKQAVKILAGENGMIGTFMAKPLFGYGAHGAHAHVSLRKSHSGRNLFFDEKSSDHLSDLARFFVGGLIAHAKALSAIVSPTVNSYKRLVPGLEAPTYLTWGWANRSVLVKIPKYFPDNPDAARIEYRGPDASYNPYLAFAVILKAGLDGVKNQIDPGPPVSENVYRLSKERLQELKISSLPASLGAAVDELKKDLIVQEALGEYSYRKYVELKEKEFEEYLAEIERTGDPGPNISDWELNRYLTSA
jgi:glutamine synthetase